MNPYRAGPIPLHNPLIPVIMPCTTPVTKNYNMITVKEISLPQSTHFGHVY